MQPSLFDSLCLSEALHKTSFKFTNFILVWLTYSKIRLEFIGFALLMLTSIVLQLKSPFFIATSRDCLYCTEYIEHHINN